MLTDLGILSDLGIIFLAQVVYVSITTVRWIILVRGRRLLAAFISFFEILVYVFALGMVVTQLHSPLKLVVYAFGYSVGAIIGSVVEEKLAIGFAVFHIITTKPSDLARQLRSEGLGVTEWQGEGRDGSRQVLMVVGRRRWAPRLISLVQRLDPHAFVVRMEPQAFRGGFMGKLLRNQQRD